MKMGTAKSSAEFNGQKNTDFFLMQRCYILTLNFAVSKYLVFLKNYGHFGSENAGEHYFKRPESIKKNKYF